MNEAENKQTEEAIHQKKDLSLCKEILLKLRKSAHAAPFLYPVDPQRLNIPDYYEKIKNPIDLSTINKKIDAASYDSLEDMIKDIDLMFANCYLYNTPDSAVHKMGQSLEKYYRQQLQKCVLDKRKAAGEKEETKRIKTRSLSEEDYSWCLKVLNEIVKTKYRRFNWPFLSPVDSALVPGYYTMIKDPMDLSKIRSKLVENKYSSFSEFAADFDLMISNCYMFNAEGSEVYICAGKLNTLFKQIFDQKKKTKEDVSDRIAELRALILQHETELRKLEKKTAANSNTFGYEEKKRLKRKIESLSVEKLKKLVAYLQKTIPLTVNEMNEIEINLDTLESSVLFAINDIAQETHTEIQCIESESSSD